jgi:hypothetical protein
LIPAESQLIDPGFKLVLQTKTTTIAPKMRLSTIAAAISVPLATNARIQPTHDKRAHFDLESDAAQSVEIHWPSGTVQTLKNVGGDRVLVVDEPAPSPGTK